MRRLLTAAAVAAAVLAAVLLTGATKGPGVTKAQYKVEFDNAFGLVKGGDFRIGGVRAGKTRSFDVKTFKGHAPRAIVDVTVTQPGFDVLRKDANCTIAPQSLIGEYYVDCQPGKSKKKLPVDGSGPPIPVEQTTSTIPADLVQDIMRRPVRERFRLILTELGTGLAGRPDDLRAVLKRAHPGLRETTRVLHILGNQNQIIENFIRDSDTVVGELAANKRDVARWVTEAGKTAEISATRRADIARSFHRLPRFLDELRPTMRRLGQLADVQTPLLTELQRAAPDLNRFFRLLGPFSKASRPALRSLGESSVVGTRAVRRGRSEVRELRRLARDARPTFKPLRQFLQTSDDRKRAIENDTRAKNAAPPSPDPTAIPGAGGFTAFEGIFDYFFWQTLSVNLGDATSRMVRLGLRFDPDCNWTVKAPSTAEERRKFAKCNQWLGPNQPGITTPDPTANRGPGDTSPVRSRTQARSRGERRSSGQPEAAPRPGQPDISKPQVKLPPGVQDLLNGLGLKQGQKLPQVPNVPKVPNVPQAPRTPQGGQLDDQGGNQLLDFLLR